MSVKPFATAPWHFKRCKSPWPDVSSRAMIQVEEILRIRFELWLDKR
jgi:hypothetical protein